MSKSGMERAADLGQAAKAIYDIIKAAMKGGWQGAAVAALKAYWPKILPIAIIIVLLPAIIICCLPAILFGWGGSSEQSKAETYQDCYQKYNIYRNEQLEDIKDEQNGVTCKIEFVNDSFDTNWLIAIDSVYNDNNINKMSEDNLKKLVKKTYTYEIAQAEPEETTSSKDPWEDTAHEIPNSSKPTEPENPTKTIKVTTSPPNTVMKNLSFDAEKTNWANLIFDTLSGGQGDMTPNDDNRTLWDMVKDDQTPYEGGEYASPFPSVKWQDHVSSEYGKRTDPVTGKEQASHNGIDIAMTAGTEIHAVASGTVLYVKDSGDSGYGLHLALNHGGKIVTLYGHTSKILVTEGQKVNQGDVIALVGTTGKSTGPHLHLEFLINGVPKNPRAYLPK